MTKQGLPAVSNLDSDSFAEFKGSDSVVLVGFFAADDKESNATFTKVASDLRDSYLFGATNDESLAEAEGVKQPAIVLYKTFDEGKNKFSKKFDKEAIEKFAKASATPLIGEVGPETYQGYMSAGIPLAYIFAETEEERKELSKELKTIAKKFRSKINFATIDAKAFGQHAGNLNLEAGKWPAFAIQDTVKNEKYPFDQEKTIDSKSIGDFVDKFTSGNLKPSIKSEPIPESQDGPVTIVVAHNYKDVVLDDSKDVLIEFYAPWCGHCKALAPKYDELGELYKAHGDKVIIAKVDATANDVPDDVQGFPTIKLYAAGKKDSPVLYSGARTVEDLAQFVKENGKYAVDAYANVSDSSEAAEEKPAVKVDDDIRDEL
jgi:protein disulfide-isomerase A1